MAYLFFTCKKLSARLECLMTYAVAQLCHRIEINQKSNSVSAPLKSMSSRMSPRASHRRHQYAILASSPGSFYRRRFSYISTKRQRL